MDSNEKMRKKGAGIAVASVAVLGLGTIAWIANQKGARMARLS